MRKFSVHIIALLCVFGLSPASNAGEPTDCALKRLASLDLTDNGALLVPVTIQGTAAFMILNTSSAISTLTESAVKRLGLRTQPIPGDAIVKSGEASVKRMTTAKDFMLGESIRFKSAEFLIVPGDPYPKASVGQAAIGVLGMSTFAHFDIELDVARRKLNLYSQDHCRDRVVYWAHHYDSTPLSFGELGEMYFPMELEGKKIEATFSSGNTWTTLHTDITKHFYDFDAHSPDVNSGTDASGNTTFHYRAMNLTSQNLTIANADIHLLEPSSSCEVTRHAGAAAYDGCLGVHPLAMGQDVLSKLHIYIATREKVLYFTRADSSD
jgi:hypothetical protein